MKAKKKTISRRTSASKRSTKFPSMLKTEITSDISLDDLVASTKEAFDVDALAEGVKEEALSFLDLHAIPYSQLLYGEQGIVPAEWLATYDHIPGVRPAFGMLFELHCFNIKRENKSEEAYAHLLRIVPRQKLLVIARMEARFYGGAARVGDGGKQSEREYRKKKLFDEYRTLREAGSSPIRARQLGAQRIGISSATAKRYFTIDQIEKLYQQFT